MTKNEIIVLFRQGKSQRQIAKQLGISRNTVAKYVNEYQDLSKKLSDDLNEKDKNLIQERICGKPKYDTSNRKKVKYNELIDKRIDELLEFEEVKNKRLGRNKQALTAKAIHEILVSEGHDIGLTVVTEHVRMKKDKLK